MFIDCWIVTESKGCLIALVHQSFWMVAIKQSTSSASFKFKHTFEFQSPRSSAIQVKSFKQKVKKSNRTEFLSWVFSWCLCLFLLTCSSFALSINDLGHILGGTGLLSQRCWVPDWSFFLWSLIEHWISVWPFFWKSLLTFSEDVSNWAVSGALMSVLDVFWFTIFLWGLSLVFWWVSNWPISRSLKTSFLGISNLTGFSGSKGDCFLAVRDWPVFWVP